MSASSHGATEPVSLLGSVATGVTGLSERIATV
jgi:hypothetical protein